MTNIKTDRTTNPLPVGTVFRPNGTKADYLVVKSGSEFSDSYDGGYWFYGMKTIRVDSESLVITNPKVREFHMPKSSWAKGTELKEYELVRKVEVRKTVNVIYELIPPGR